MESQTARKRWLRFWELIMCGGILASIVADSLGYKGGYYVFGAVAAMGFIGWTILDEKTTREDRENSPPGNDPQEK